MATENRGESIWSRLWKAWQRTGDVNALGNAYRSFKDHSDALRCASPTAPGCPVVDVLNVPPDPHSFLGHAAGMHHHVAMASAAYTVGKHSWNALEAASPGTTEAIRNTAKVAADGYIPPGYAYEMARRLPPKDRPSDYELWQMKLPHRNRYM